MTDEEIAQAEHIDPRQFLQRQGKIRGNPEEEAYKDFCDASYQVLRSIHGKEFMKGLKRLCEYGSSAFRAEDGFNTHAAAARDGAHGLITEILVAAQQAKKI